MNERHGSFATKSVMPPAYCDTAPAELATMAELVEVAGKALAEAVGHLDMIEDDVNPCQPAAKDCDKGVVTVTLFDRVRAVSELASNVADRTLRIRRRLGKTE